MGFSTKDHSGDQGLDWEDSLGAAEMSKPPSALRQLPRQQESEQQKCPRCDSTNTKFCYYNNYNKSQPRHFCKSCKRHWTNGGTLRNVPVGGGRKNKRPKISISATATSTTPSIAHIISTTHTNQNTNLGRGTTVSTTAPTTTTQLTNQTTHFPFSTNSTDQKNMSRSFYQALIRSSSPLLLDTNPFSNNGTINATAAIENPSTEFSFSCVTSGLDENASIFPSSYTYDQFCGNLDSMEESTITTVNVPSTSNGIWTGPDTGGTMDLPSYWNWNEIDVLTSADNLNIAWDDDGDGNDNGAEIKP